MNRKSRLLFLLGLAALILLACNLPGGLSSLVATETPEASKTPRPTRTEQFTETPEMPTWTPRPTYSPTPEYTPTQVPQPYYLDELEGDVSNWNVDFVFGDENGYTVTQDDTGLLITVDAADTYVYLVNYDYTYTDVRLDVQATNYGYNNNNISLVCRYSDAGWYEASAFSSGMYFIYKFEPGEGYVVLKEGGIISMLTGRHENRFTMVCQENRIEFIVNDVEIASLTDSSFSDGIVGINLSSYDILPVEVHFEWVQVSEP